MGSRQGLVLGTLVGSWHVEGGCEIVAPSGLLSLLFVHPILPTEDEFCSGSRCWLISLCFDSNLVLRWELLQVGSIGIGRGDSMTTASLCLMAWWVTQPLLGWV